jgi:hypothetical protein
VDRSAVRPLGLLLVAFVATFGLLVGGWALLGRAAGGSARPAGSVSAAPSGRPSPIAIASPSPAPSLPSAVDPGASDAANAPPVVLLGAGDIADCALDGARKTADVVAGETGWVFTLGDNAYPDGSPAEFASCYAPTWGRFLDRTILPAPGNHDWDTDGAAGYRAYFGSRATPDGETWYSMDLATWHIVVLDSDCAKVGGCDAGSPQGKWLAADLRASKSRCTLALWHQPRFSSGVHGDDPEVAPFWDLLHDDGADLVLNGHDHDYERFAPMDPSGKVDKFGGMRELVVGTGGAELRGFVRAEPSSEFRQAGSWGVLRLTLYPFQYTWEFLPATGQIADGGRTLCH